MKLAWLGSVNTPAIIEHTKNVTQGCMPNCEGAILEDVLQAAPEIPVINTCIAAKNFMLHKTLRDEVLEAFGVIKHTPHAFLYGFFNGENFSDLIEISYKIHFMSHDAGPALGFVQGAAMPCSPAVYQAFPNLEKIRSGLADLEYRGEITIGITKNFQICSIAFGHFSGGWSLYTEMSTQTAQNNFEFCFGEQKECKVHENCIAFNTLLSLHPYPCKIKINTQIKAVAGAEKHLYRQWYTPEQEIAYACCWGNSISEARQRIYRIINNCKQYSPDLQYRSDVGRNCKFIFNTDTFTRLERLHTPSHMTDTPNQIE